LRQTTLGSQSNALGNTDGDGISDLTFTLTSTKLSTFNTSIDRLIESMFNLVF